MRSDFIVILVIFLVIGEFTFIKGFQNNLQILDIVTIFVTFIGFLIAFALLTASISNIMNWILNILFKK